ncbi:glycosyltransferase family 4 protein [Roseiconus lacunae]|uniref:glycosyltransferase family 4 protein n=1 Tax=Roseiconus lacunae TaxID=2605694 RepID=UPI0013D91EEB
MRRLIGLWQHLVASRGAGVRVVWTIHNEVRHEGVGFGDRWGYRILASASDLVIVHSESAKRFAIGLGGVSKNVVKIDHGLYPEDAPDNGFFRKAAAPNAPTVGCLGLIRRYKNYSLVERAVDRMEGPVRCLLAGSVENELSAWAGRVERKGWTVVDRFLTKEELSAAMLACDAIAIPYSRITTSGLLAMAWSYRRPVVTLPLPYFTDYARRFGDAVITVADDDSPDAYAEALQRCLAVDPLERSEAFDRVANALDWSRCVAPLREREEFRNFVDSGCA